MKELIAIQKELKAPKTQYNKFGKYQYRSCEDILEAVKPLLIKYGCTLTLSDEMVNMGNRFYIKTTARFSNKDKILKVTAYAREAETKKGMDEAQITGAASSYARKYALNGLFLIDDCKDPDRTIAPQNIKMSMDNPQQVKQQARTKPAQTKRTRTQTRPPASADMRMNAPLPDVPF